MVRRTDSTTITDIVPDFYNGEDKFAGFPFAFGISSYFSGPPDHDYGSVKAYVRSWNGTFAENRSINVRKCTPADFGLGTNEDASKK